MGQPPPYALRFSLITSAHVLRTQLCPCALWYTTQHAYISSTHTHTCAHCCAQCTAQCSVLNDSPHTVRSSNLILEPSLINSDCRKRRPTATKSNYLANHHGNRALRVVTITITPLGLLVLKESPKPLILVAVSLYQILLCL